MEKAERLRGLRERLPSSHCKDGCFECCKAGAGVTLTELSMMPAISEPSAEGCIYLKGGKCSVYSERPFRCRLFGLAESGLFHCPDCEPDEPITPDEAEDLIREYKLLTDGEMIACTAMKELD